MSLRKHLAAFGITFALVSMLFFCNLGKIGITAAADTTHSAPSGLTMVSPNGKYNKIDVRWDPVSGATKYRVLLASEFSDKVIAAHTVVTGTRATFSKLEAGTEYRAQVVAYFSDNTKKKSPIVKVSTAPKAPSGFNLGQRTYYSAVLNWNEVDEADGYHFYLGTNNSVVLARTTNTSVEISKYLTAGTKNTIYVRSKKYLSDGKVVYSKYKKLGFKVPAVEKTLPVTPIDQNASNGGLNGTISASCGCGPTALTMVINGDKGKSYSKDEALKIGYNHGYSHNVTQYYRAQLSYVDSYVGTTLEDIKNIASVMGYSASLDHMYSDSKAEMLKKIDLLLDSGHRVVIGHRMTTGYNHFVVCYGRNSSGSYLIVDPLGGYCNVWTRDFTYGRITAVDLTHNLSKQDRGILWLR